MLRNLLTFHTQITSHVLNLKSLDNTDSCPVLMVLKIVTIHIVVQLSMMFKDKNLEKYKASTAL